MWERRTKLLYWAIRRFTPTLLVMERMLHNIPINWITCALSQSSTLYYSAYLAALCVNLHPVNITNNIVPIVEISEN